jgi:tetratricopeptide (TPR) repeat protein
MTIPVVILLNNLALISFASLVGREKLLKSIVGSRALRRGFLPAALGLGMAALPAMAQDAATPEKMPSGIPPVEKNASSDHASAYYNFSMGHLYAEMAQAYNRQDYVTKAIESYKLALKEDPSISFITEELTDLYVQSGQLNKAVTEAEDLLKQNPDNLGARRILGRVYTRLIGDPQQGKIDEKMLHLSIEQYQKIAEKDPDDDESQLLLARLYRIAHDPASAEKVFQALLAKQPDNDEALTGLASIYAERGDGKNAIDMLKRASDTNPTARTLVTLATFYEQASDYANAADAWKKALEIAPDNDRWKRALALDLLFSDHVQEARKLYEQFAIEDPTDAQVQSHLAEIYLQQRELPKARVALNAAKQADPTNIAIRYDDVMLLEAEGKSDDAIKSLKGLLDEMTKAEYTAAERSQRDKLEERLGMLYRAAGKYPQAIAAFREIGPEDTDLAPRATVQIVETLRQSKDLSGARKESDAALKKFPKDRTVVMEHATLLADSGKVDQAIAEVEGLKDTKNDREIILAEAQLYERAKRYTEETKALDEAQKLSSGKTEVTQVRFARGAMLEKMKNFEGAENEFRVIIKDEPENAGALNYLGYMLADRNQRLEEAQQLVLKALEIDPGNGAYLDSLGWVYYHQNHLEAAEEQLRNALDKIKDDPTVHDHLGDVLVKQGKVKEAIVQWQSSLKSYEANQASQDVDPTEMAKVQSKLDDARVRMAQQTHAHDAH